MTFPMWYFLIPYAIFALLATMFTFFNLLQMARFGLQSVKTSVILSIYVIAFICVMAFTIILVFSFEWSQMTSVSELLQLNGNNAANFL
jgi:hypothetical protein